MTGEKRYRFARFFLVVFFFAVFRFFAPFFFTAMLPSRVDAGEDGNANRKRDALACQSMRRRDHAARSAVVRPQIAACSRP